MRKYNEVQLAHIEKTKTIWSPVFHEYQEVEIGESLKVMTLDEIKQLGYKYTDPEDIEENFNIDIDESNDFPEWAVVALSFKSGLDLKNLIGFLELFEEIKNAWIYSKDTAYLLHFEYGILPLVTPIIFNK